MKAAVHCALYRKRPESVTGVGSSVNKVSYCRDRNILCSQRSLEVAKICILDHMDRPAFSVSTDWIYGFCKPRIIVKFIFNFHTNFTQVSSLSICMNIFHFQQLDMMTYLPFCLHFGRNSPSIFRFWKIFGTKVVMDNETRLFYQ